MTSLGFINYTQLIYKYTLYKHSQTTRPSTLILSNSIRMIKMPNSNNMGNSNSNNSQQVVNSEDKNKLEEVRITKNLMGTVIILIRLFRKEMKNLRRKILKWMNLMKKIQRKIARNKIQLPKVCKLKNTGLNNRYFSFY